MELKEILMIQRYYAFFDIGNMKMKKRFLKEIGIKPTSTNLINKYFATTDERLNQLKQLNMTKGELNLRLY